MRFSPHIPLFVLWALCSCQKPPNDEGPVSYPYDIGLGNSPYWCNNSDTIVFERDSQILLFDTSEAVKELVIENGLNPAISPDGELLAYEWDRVLFLYNFSSRQTIEVGPGIMPDWSSSGYYLAFANSTAHKKLSNGFIVIGTASSDSSLYYYSLIDSAIYNVKIENYSLLHNGSNVTLSSPIWGPADSLLFFTTEYGIWFVSVAGGEASRYDSIGYY